MIDGVAAAIKTFSPFACEAFSLLRACEMAITLHLEVVEFESDYRELCLAVSGSKVVVDWRCEAIIFDICLLFSSNSGFSLKWISRHSNMAVDCVARLATKKKRPLGWVSTPPSSLALILSSDFSVACNFADRDGVG